MKLDYHIHTNYSDDGQCTMEEIVARALELGLDEICFTDHVDYGIKLDPENMTEEERKHATKPLNVDYPRYVKEIRDLRERYKDRLQIKMGLEFGAQIHTLDAYEKLFARYDFDFIILSNHQVRDKEFWTGDFQRGKTQEEYIHEYYNAIYDVMCHFDHYSVLGHLDMIKRYDQDPRYPDEKIHDLLEKILRKAIADGKGIEVNTSSFQYGLPDLMPSTYILKLYHDLGGRIITIGSDCHTADRLADHTEEVMAALRKIGFQEICTFTKMKPVFHPL